MQVRVKNYEIASTFVKVTPKNVALFNFPDTVYIINIIVTFICNCPTYCT